MRTITYLVRITVEIDEKYLGPCAYLGEFVDEIETDHPSATVADWETLEVLDDSANHVGEN